MTAPRKQAPTAASSSLRSSKITLALAGTCVVVAAGLALRATVSPAVPVETVMAASLSSPSGLASPAPRAGALPDRAGVAQLSSISAASEANSSRQSADDDRHLSPPEGSTKVSVRPVSSSAGVPLAGSVPASGSSVPSEQASEGISVSLVGGSNLVAGCFKGVSSSTVANRAAADAVRLARSSATQPLSHAVTDDQVKQAAPQVPQEVIDTVRDQFEQAAGVGQLDPSDPEYARHWDTAEREAADQMRSLYGWGAYAAMQRQTALAAAGQPGQ